MPWPHPTRRISRDLVPTRASDPALRDCETNPLSDAETISQNCETNPLSGGNVAARPQSRETNPLSGRTGEPELAKQSHFRGTRAPETSQLRNEATLGAPRRCLETANRSHSRGAYTILRNCETKPLLGCEGALSARNCETKPFSGCRDAPSKMRNEATFRAPRRSVAPRAFWLAESLATQGKAVQVVGGTGILASPEHFIAGRNRRPSNLSRWQNEATFRRMADRSAPGIRGLALLPPGEFISIRDPRRYRVGRGTGPSDDRPDEDGGRPPRTYPGCWPALRNRKLNTSPSIRACRGLHCPPETIAPLASHLIREPMGRFASRLPPRHPYVARFREVSTMTVPHPRLAAVLLLALVSPVGTARGACPAEMMAGDGVPPDAAGLYETGKVWTIHLRFRPEQWAALEPKGGPNPFDMSSFGFGIFLAGAGDAGRGQGQGRQPLGGGIPRAGRALVRGLGRGWRRRPRLEADPGRAQRGADAAGECE